VDGALRRVEPQWWHAAETELKPECNIKERAVWVALKFIVHDQKPLEE
jgi:hypothetical protein